MVDPDNALRRLVEEGARASNRPSLAQLRRRAARRRRRQMAATATAMAAILLAVVPMLEHERPGHDLAGPPRPHVLQPAITASTGPLTATPVVAVQGGTVMLHGAGCAPGSTVEAGLGSDAPADTPSGSPDKYTAQPPATFSPASIDTGQKSTHVQALATGFFTADLTIPPDTASGVVTLWAQCESPAPARVLTLQVSITIHHP